MASYVYSSQKFSNQICPIIEIEVAYDDSKETTTYENIDTATNLKYYGEKTKGGSLSYQAYKPLKERVEELCKQELEKGKIDSARQLCIIVSKLIEENHKNLLKSFTPYQNQISGNDWTQPTFYNWCNQVFKNYKS